VRIVLVATLALLATGPVAAQQADRQERPFKPMYADEATAPKVSFIFAGSVHEGRGEEGGGEFGASGLERGRYYTGGQLGATYIRRGRRVILAADGSGGARYYRDLGEVTTVGHRASAGAEFLMGRARLQIAHAYRDNPFQQLLPQVGADGEATRNAANPDSSLSSTHTVQHASTVGWRRAFGRRSELAFNYGYSTTKIGDGAVQDMQQGGASFRHRVSRGLELKLGHQARVFEDTQNPTGERVIAHDLDLGLDLDRELSFSRRTRVGFSSGSSIVSTDAGRRMMATGQASLKHEIGRSWNALASVGRKVDFVEGLQQPVVGQTLSFGLGGYWGRRFNVMLRGAAGDGKIATETGGDYRSITTEARGSFAISRGITCFAEHFYYQHTVSGAFLPAGVPPTAYRRGLRTGVDVKLDAIRRRR